MNGYELWALGHYLSSYPQDENLSFDEILSLVEKEDESITHWEPFEYHTGEAVAELIRNEADNLPYYFDIKK